MSDTEIRTDDRELTVSEIQAKIIRLPGRPPAMLDRDLAEIYGVETKHLNRAANRNPDRFPADFRFRLTAEEVEYLRCQSVTAISNMSRVSPWAYTWEGSNMLSAVLESGFAVARSVFIMRAFSATEQEMRRQIAPADISLIRKVLTDFAETLQNTLTETVRQAVTEAVRKSLAEAIRQAVAEAAEPEQSSAGPHSENPVASFVTLLCKAEPDARTPKDELYDLYMEFCDERDVYPLTKNVFFKNLYAHAGYTRSVTITIRGSRIPAVRGILLK